MESPKCHVGKYSQVKIVKYRVKNPAPGEADKDTDFCFFLKYGDALYSGKSYPLFINAYRELGRIEDAFINDLSEAKNRGITSKERESILKSLEEHPLINTRDDASVLDYTEIDYDAEEAVRQAIDELEVEKSESSSVPRELPQIKKSTP